MDATDCDYETADKALNECDNHCKTAIVMILLNCDANEAKAKLQLADGFVRKAVEK